MAEKIELVRRHVDMFYIEGKNLKMHREAAGLSQRQLAKEIFAHTGIEIDHRRISELENSFEFPVDDKMVEALKKILCPDFRTDKS